MPKLHLPINSIWNSLKDFLNRASTIVARFDLFSSKVDCFLKMNTEKSRRSSIHSTIIVPGSVCINVILSLRWYEIYLLLCLSQTERSCSSGNIGKWRIRMSGFTVGKLMKHFQVIFTYTMSQGILVGERGDIGKHATLCVCEMHSRWTHILHSKVQNYRRVE